MEPSKRTEYHEDPEGLQDIREDMETGKLLRKLTGGGEPELTEADRKYIIKLIRRDVPASLGRYRGTIEGIPRNLICCGVCRIPLRRISEKRRPEENRFCPACGTRIKWPEEMIESALNPQKQR